MNQDEQETAVTSCLQSTRNNTLWKSILTSLVVPGIVSFLVAVTSAQISLNTQFKKQARTEHIRALKQLISYLEYINEEMSINGSLLKSEDTLLPRYTVLSMAKHPEDMKSKAPIFAGIESLITLGYEGTNKQLAIERTRAAHAQSEDVRTHQAFSQFLAGLRSTIHSAEYLVFDYVSSIKLEIAFMQTAQKADILFDLPLDYVLELRSLLSIFHNINNSLYRFEEISKDFISPNIMSYFMPIPIANERVKIEKERLDQYVNQLEGQRIDNFITYTQKLLHENKDKLNRISKQMEQL